AVAGSLAVEGSVIEWCATHRRHHAFADQYGDPHSPHLARAAGVKGVVLGLWHAHFGWLLGPERSDPNEWTPDLMADPAIRKVDRAFRWLVAVTFLVPAAIGWAVTGTLGGALGAFVWRSPVRVVLLPHVTW